MIALRPFSGTPLELSLICWSPAAIRAFTRRRACASLPTSAPHAPPDQRRVSVAPSPQDAAGTTPHGAGGGGVAGATRGLEPVGRDHRSWEGVHRRFSGPGIATTGLEREGGHWQMPSHPMMPNPRHARAVSRRVTMIQHYMVRRTDMLSTAGALRLVREAQGAEALVRLRRLFNAGDG